MDLQANNQIKNWLSQSQTGSETAFHELYDFLRGSSFRFLLARVSSREDAQDILQEAFIDLWRSLKSFQYQSDAQFYAFIFKILRRKLSKYYSRHKLLTPFDEKYLQENYESAPEDFRYLLVHLKNLPDKYRVVVELRYWSQMSFAEISQWLGETENNVKVRHHRAIKKLEDLLTQYEQ